VFSLPLGWEINIVKSAGNSGIDVLKKEPSNSGIINIRRGVMLIMVLPLVVSRSNSRSWSWDGNSHC
jgi:hypothetical protein